MKILFKTGEEYYMDGTLKNNLDLLKKNIKKDWDFVIIISSSGIPGAGKSMLAQQIAYYLDPEFQIENMCMSAEQFHNKGKALANTGKKGVALVYDEAKFGLDAKRAMESMTKALLDFFAECRQLNAYLILVLPDYFDLKKEIALNRSVCLINCYCQGELERGYFSFYSRDKKKGLYVKGRKWLNYKIVSPDFRGRFTKFYTIPEQEYRKRKSEAMIEGQKKVKERITRQMQRWKNDRDALIRHLSIKHRYTDRKIAEIMSINTRAVNLVTQLAEGQNRIADI